MAVTARDIFDQLHRTCSKDELRNIGLAIEKMLAAEEAASKAGKKR